MQTFHFIVRISNSRRPRVAFYASSRPWTFRPRLFPTKLTPPPWLSTPLLRVSTPQRSRRSRQSDGRERVVSLHRVFAPISRVPLDTLAKFSTPCDHVCHAFHRSTFSFSFCRLSPPFPSLATRVRLSEERFPLLRFCSAFYGETFFLPRSSPRFFPCRESAMCFCIDHSFAAISTIGGFRIFLLHFILFRWSLEVDRVGFENLFVATVEIYVDLFRSY